MPATTLQLPRSSSSLQPPMIPPCLQQHHLLILQEVPNHFNPTHQFSRFTDAALAVLCAVTTHC